MKNKFISKILSVVLSLAFTAQQLSVSAPPAHALGVESFTDPYFEIQKNSNIVKAYFVSALEEFRKQNRDLANGALTRDNFSTLNLRENRVQVDKVESAQDGIHKIYCEINGNVFIATLDLSKNDVSVVPAVDLDPKKIRPFPAPSENVISRSELSNILPTFMRNVEHIVERRGDLLVESDEKELREGLASLFKFFEERNVFDEVGGTQEFFDGLTSENYPLLLQKWTGASYVMENMIWKILEKCPYLREDIAKILFAFGHVFYLQKNDNALKFTAIRKCEFFYRMAHQLAPGNSNYHMSWAFALKHGGAPDKAKEEFAKILLSLSQGDRDIEKGKAALNIANIMLDDVWNLLREFEVDPKSIIVSDIGKTRKMLADVHALLGKNVLESPRALSSKGIACISECRLNKVVYAHKKGIGNAKDSAESDINPHRFVYQNIIYAAYGVKWMKRACNKASRREFVIPAEVKHADGMLRDGLKETARLLEYLWKEIKSEELYFDNKAACNDINKALTNIEAACNGSQGFDDLRKTLTEMKAWLSAGSALRDDFKACLKEYLLDKKSEYLSPDDVEKIIPGIKNKIFKGHAGAFPEKVISASSDAVWLDMNLEMDDLVIVYVWKGLEPKERSILELKKKVDDLYGSTYGDEKFQTHFARVKNIFGISAEETLVSKEEGADGLLAHEKDRLDKLSAQELTVELNSARTSPAVKVYVAKKLSGVTDKNSAESVFYALKIAYENEKSSFSVRYWAVSGLVDSLKKIEYQPARYVYELLYKNDMAGFKDLPDKKSVVMPIVMMALKDKEAAVRLVAARALGELNIKKESEIFEGLKNLLLDSDRSVSEAVKETLSKIKPISAQLFGESIHAKNGFLATIDELEEKAVSLSSWRQAEASKDGLSPLYGLLEEAEALRSDINKYQINAVYSNSKGEKCQELSGEYYAMTAAIARFADNIKLAQKYVQSMIDPSVSGSTASLERFKKLSDECGVREWVEDQAYLIGGHIEAIKSISNDGNNPDFLSHEAYVYLSKQIADAFERTELYMLALESYKIVLSELGRVKAKAGEIDVRLDSSQAIERYIARLDALKDAFISKAFDHITFDEINPDEKRSLEDVLDGMKSLEKIEAAINAAENRLGSIEIGKEKLKENLSWIFGVIEKDLDYILSNRYDEKFWRVLDEKIALACDARLLREEVRSLGVDAAEAGRRIPDLKIGAVYEFLDEAKIVFGEIFTNIGEAEISQEDSSEKISLSREKLMNVKTYLAGIKPIFYAAWLDEFGVNLTYYGGFAITWLDSRLSGLNVDSEVNRLKKIFEDILSVAGNNAPSRDDIGVIAEKLAEVNKILQTVHKKHRAEFSDIRAQRLFDVNALVTRMTLNYAINDRNGTEDGRQYLTSLNEPLEYVVVPIFNQDGVLSNVELTFFRSSTSSTAMITAGLLPITETEDSLYMSYEDLLGLLNDALDLRKKDVQKKDEQGGIGGILKDISIIEKSGLDIRKTYETYRDYSNRYNMTVAGHSSIAMSPEHTFNLLEAVSDYYAQAILLTSGGKFSGGMDVSIEKVFGRIVEGSDPSDAGLPANKLKENYALKTLEGKLEILKKKESSGSLSKTEQAWEKIMERVIHATKAWESRQNFYESDDERNLYYDAAMRFLNKITGNVFPRRTIMISKTVVPILEEYGGVYADFKDSSETFGNYDEFKVSLFVYGEKSEALAGLLRKSFDVFLESIPAPKDDKNTNEEWFWQERKLFENFSLMHDGKREQIEFVVVENLPRVSLSRGNTIIFDKAFIDFILNFEGTSDEGTAEFIFAERLFHEFGHIFFKNPDENPAEEEAAQIERDVIFHEVIFGLDKEFGKKVEEFVAKNSVSKIFKSSALFGKIQTWAVEYRQAYEAAKKVIAEEVRNVYMGFPDELKVQIKSVDGLERQAVGAAIITNMDPGRLNGMYNKLLITLAENWAKIICDYKKKMRGEIINFVVKTPGVLFPSDKDLRAFPAPMPKSILDTGFLKSVTDLDLDVLNNESLKDEVFLSKNRTIAISESLIPGCQKGLIKEINKLSAEAVKEGRTNDLIKILPTSGIMNLKSDENSDVIVVLEKTEAGLYDVKEKRLVFEKLSPDSPVAINGLVAAGRAALYKDMNKLRDILKLLSMDKNLELPSAEELLSLFENDAQAFTKATAIILPAAKADPGEIAEYNKNLVYMLQFA